MSEYLFGNTGPSEEVKPVVYVRDEPPRLLWRSIVQGFGLAVGFFLATVLSWALIVIFVFFVLQQAPPSLPRL